MRWFAPVLLAAACAACAACGHNHDTPDAAHDASHDTDASDAMPPSDGPCGAELHFTGEYVDFDSVDNGAFCGIFGGTFQVHGDATRTDQSNPNGRFELCLAQADQTRIDITPPTAASECETGPGNTYAVPGIIIADKAVIESGATVSARAFTAAEQTMFASQSLFTYDSTKAQLFVHVDGTPAAVSITGTSDAPLAWDGTKWAAGNTGANVFFPNVVSASGTTTISIAGTALGTGSYPLEPGTITYATLVVQ